MSHQAYYHNRRVMITGGLGFIGSNLAHRLVELGADVLLVDSLIPDYGGNLYNITGIEHQVRVNVADVRQQSTINYLVRHVDVIFNLAGQVSHIDHADPFTDLEINCRSQLSTSRPAAVTTRPRSWSLRARGSTANPMSCRSPNSTWCGPSM